VVKQLSTGKVHLPLYYKADSTSQSTRNGKTITDTIYHSVSDLVLTNQLGKTISLNKDLAGKFVVINFFFVNCPSICPRLSSNMRLLQSAFKKNPRKESQVDTLMQLISITVNPAHDSFPVLRDYADRYGANHDHWWFLTGDKKVIYDFARNELGVVADQGDGGPHDFIHTEKIVLLDKDRHIRGYYNGLDSVDVKRCADDIILLTLEKKHDKK
jgi:protein SCO1/2